MKCLGSWGKMGGSVFLIGEKVLDIFLIFRGLRILTSLKGRFRAKS